MVSNLDNEDAAVLTAVARYLYIYIALFIFGIGLGTILGAIATMVLK